MLGLWATALATAIGARRDDGTRTMLGALRRVRRALRRPDLLLLQFEPVAADQRLGRVWAAADNKFAFTITSERNVSISPDPFFVAHVRWLDGSHQRRIGWDFKTFDAAVRLCSNFTRELRRQVAYHEAGHAVVAWLLGFSGVWIDMEDNAYRAITRYDCLPPMLAVVDASLGALLDGGGRAVLAGYLYEDLMFSVAGMVAEAKIAGYPAGYVEVDVAGRTSATWGAVRVACIEAGLPVCGRNPV
jgi:hypothetical protein